MKEKKQYKLVAIGGSLGGMEAVTTILSLIPENFPVPIVIVLHRLKNTKNILSDLINNKVAIKVKEVDEKEFLKPGLVYISPANYHILLEKDLSISLDYSEPVNYSRPSIDIFFESAARVLKEQIVGIILTGANEDGSKGLNKIAQNGGLTIVQTPESAVSDTMPKAAIKHSQVDRVMDLKDIGEFLNRLLPFQ